MERFCIPLYTAPSTEAELLWTKWQPFIFNMLKYCMLLLLVFPWPWQDDDEADQIQDGGNDLKAARCGPIPSAGMSHLHQFPRIFHNGRSHSCRGTAGCLLRPKLVSTKFRPPECPTSLVQSP